MSAATTARSGRRPTLRLVALAVVLVTIGLAGCSQHIPRAYTDKYAKPNFMGQCVKGSPPKFCECVWAKIVKTIPWDEYSKFDAAQAKAKSDKDIPDLPKGIQTAVTQCADQMNGETTTTTKSESKSTTTAKESAPSTTDATTTTAK